MTKRYRTVRAREFRAGAFVFGGLGLAYLVFIAVLVFTSNEPPPTVRLAAISLPGIALATLGVVLYLRKRDWLAVDLETRVARFFRDGKERWSAPLDEFVALHIRQVHRRQYDEGKPAVRIDYHVFAGSREIAIYSGATYLPARRFAVRTARLWRIGLVPLDGRVRARTDIDTPLWRLPTNATRTAATPPPASVAIEETSDRTTLRAARSLLGSEFPNVLWLVAAGFAGLMLYDRPISLFDLEIAADPTGEAAQQLGLLAVVAVALGRFAYEAWPMFLPAAILVDARTVSYRGRRVPTGAVLEIVSAENIAVIAANRTFSIPPDFAAPHDQAALIDTLRALVARYGARSA